MDLILLISVFVALLAVLLSLLYLKSKGSKDGKESKCCHWNFRWTLANKFLESPKPAQQAAAAPVAPRLVRNQGRNRVRAAEQHAPAPQQQQNDSDDDATGVEFDEKIGAKKRAKLEAKAEKKAHREADLKSREEQKKRDGEFRPRTL